MDIHAYSEHELVTGSWKYEDRWTRDDARRMEIGEHQAA